MQLSTNVTHTQGASGNVPLLSTFSTERPPIILFRPRRKLIQSERKRAVAKGILKREQRIKHKRKGEPTRMYYSMAIITIDHTNFLKNGPRVAIVPRFIIPGSKRWNEIVQNRKAYHNYPLNPFPCTEKDRQCFRSLCWKRNSRRSVCPTTSQFPSR